MSEQEIYYIPKNEWQKFLASMTSLFNVLAPEEGLFNPEFARISPENSERIVFPGARLTSPLKVFLYPPKEDLLSDPLPQDKKSVILGVKACDLRATAILDHIFLDPDFVDPF
jgi:hypothetical protein